MSENKKQCLYTAAMVALALIVGIAALFCIKKYDVHAEDTLEVNESSESGYIRIGSCKNIMNQNVDWYAPGHQSYYCTYQAANNAYIVLARGDSFGGVQSFGTYANIWSATGSSTSYGNFVLNNNGYYTVDDFYLSPGASLLIKVPKFSSAEKAILYAKGEIDITEADNYSEIAADLITNSYSNSMPRYDKLTITVNNNDTATVTASMSPEQIEIYQDGFVGNTNPYVLELHNYAIYAKKDKIGIFNDFVLKYGLGNKLENTLPNNKKIDELIQYDSDDRLLVKSYAGEGATSKCLYDDFMTRSDSSYLMASRQKNISPPDGVIATSTYTIDITPASNNIGTGSDTYDLIGYCSVIAICKKDDDGNYITGDCTYSYSWLTSAIANRYGNKSESYTPDGTQVSGSSNYYDKVTGSDLDITGISSGTSKIDSDSLVEHVKNGYGLAGDDGYLNLTQRFLQGVPEYIWWIVAMALSINLLAIALKIFRGM